MKLKILQTLTGKFGPLVIPVISGLIGTLIGYFYTWFHGMTAKAPWLDQFCNDVWMSFPVYAQESLHPTAIGAVFGLIAYGLIQEWLKKFFIKDVKEQQTQLNTALPHGQKITVDGIPLEETREARDAVIGAAKDVRDAIQVRRALPNDGSI
jgi:hypothetical protein